MTDTRTGCKTGHPVTQSPTLQHIFLKSIGERCRYVNRLLYSKLSTPDENRTHNRTNQMEVTSQSDVTNKPCSIRLYRVHFVMDGKRTRKTIDTDCIHRPLFSNFLFTNLFSIKFLYFFIISIYIGSTHAI